jgi:hypothetical protein
MPTIEVSEQYFGNYAGPLDVKLNPVNNLDELYNNIKRKNRYLGMTVLVLDDGTGDGPAEYWLVGGTANNNWVKKTASGSLTLGGDDIE